MTPPLAPTSGVPLAENVSDALDVLFTGTDGMQQVFSFASLPMPDFHADLAAAFQARCQALNSVKSADSLFRSATRLLTFLSELEQPPSGIGKLTPDHMRQLLYFRVDSTTLTTARSALWDVCRLLRHIEPSERLMPGLRGYLALSRNDSDFDAGTAWPGRQTGQRDKFAYLRHEEDPDNPLIVPFIDPDGARRAFDFTPLPLPDLRPALTAAFRAELGPEGAGVSSDLATSLFLALENFLTYLAGTDQPPRSMAQMMPAHLDEIRRTLRQTYARKWADRQLALIRQILRHVTPYEQFSTDFRACLEHGTATQVAAPSAAPARPGRGRTSAMPDGPYEPEAARASIPTTLAVPFTGEDGRRWHYNFAELPSPALHSEFASAFAVRVGPTGTLRTEASARTDFSAIKRFLAFLDALARPPKSVGDLTVRHLERYRLHRLETVKEPGVLSELTSVRLLLQEITPSSVLSAELRDYLRRPGHTRRRTTTASVPGYSDRELRDLMAAARSDVVAIRDRIRKAERLLEAFRAAPEALSSDERFLAEHLDVMDRTGRVSAVRTHLRQNIVEGRLELARQLFLTDADLAPLTVLAVGLTGRNVETVKELPHAHRMLEDRAVAVDLIKRRRSKATTRETVHWETGGSDSRQLHTPGGLYLLLHQLTARGRRHSGSERLWSIWTGASGTKGVDWEAKAAAHGHIDPYANRLGRVMGFSKWGQRHGLLDDSGKTLPIDMNRLKTTVEVRRTKAMGGHLPSASRTNTLDVSFANYLKGDPVVRDWADEILTTAINEAEDTARGFRPRVLTKAQAAAQAPGQSAAVLGTTEETLHQALDGQLDTVASSCLDIEHSPFTDGRCDVSFLTCLRCPNALITEDHLPALLALVDTLDTARQSMDMDAWVSEHGRTWLALTRLILPRFTDAERDQAAQAKPAPQDLGLDLLDVPKDI
ncbi:hypothetical protein P1P75_05890 [Streptomyces sp. ID05-39B]|uniref:hypothetical protein n=1 Tax=Streptomyces sp. ID05-39B TaxID=3028664 RepID=UPI0029A81EAC|nr:hypothetical protein [Streptomyces sp. ID05-39B]MDX3525977.1 hypothetical protein [Streptomyces sp. ID05-39B]